MASPRSSDLARLRQNAASALQANVAAQVALQSALVDQAETCRSLIGALEVGQPVPGMLVKVSSHEARPALTARIRAFERTRHRARLRLIEVAIAEGATDQDVRELWSISQEMVRRAKREIAELEDFEDDLDIDEVS